DRQGARGQQRELGPGEVRPRHGDERAAKTRGAVPQPEPVRAGAFILKESRKDAKRPEAIPGPGASAKGSFCVFAPRCYHGGAVGYPGSARREAYGGEQPRER